MGDDDRPGGHDPRRTPEPVHAEVPHRAEVAERARHALGHRSPRHLLALASSVAAALDAHGADTVVWFEDHADDGDPALAAVALAYAAMHPSPQINTRFRLITHGSRATLPLWLAGLDTMEVTGVAAEGHVLDDVERLHIAFAWGARASAAIVVTLHHTADRPVVTGVDTNDHTSRDLQDMVRDQRGGGVFRSIRPVEARARIAQAVAAGDDLDDPFTSATWPGHRPLLEWVLRHLPEGGTGYDRPPSSPVDRERFVDRFMRSHFGEIPGLAPDHVRAVTAELVRFRCGFGAGQPLRWGPSAVATVLADWYPANAPPELHGVHDRVPDVLGALVLYSHARLRVDRSTTYHVLWALDQWRRSYGAFIVPRTRVRTLDVGRRAVAALRLSERESDFIDLVGSEDAVAALTDEPLPDFPFDWSMVPEHRRPATAAVLARADGWAVELFDAEVRTIARAVLAAAVAAQPDIVVSKRGDHIAAGLLWCVAKHITGTLGPDAMQPLWWEVRTGKELSNTTGVSTGRLAKRAAAFAEAAFAGGFTWDRALHSALRREAFEVRKRADESREFKRMLEGRRW
jgi:hypothetical protein